MNIDGMRVLPMGFPSMGHQARSDDRIKTNSALLLPLTAEYTVVIIYRSDY
jgi:hypothetical protein